MDTKKPNRRALELEKVKEYRDRARECRSLAQGARSSEEREQLLNMAESWERFAIERERRLRDLDKESK